MIMMMNDEEAGFVPIFGFIAFFKKSENLKLNQEFLLLIFRLYHHCALTCYLKKDKLLTFLFFFVIARQIPQRTTSALPGVFWCPQFEAKLIQIVQKNATITRNGNHSFCEKVINRVILSNEKQLNKNSSYISKMEPSSSEIQKVMGFKIL